MHKGHLRLTRRGQRRKLESTPGVSGGRWNGLGDRGAVTFPGVFMEEGSEGVIGGGARRRREARPRTRVVKLRLSEEEYAAVTDAARREGWACGAFVAHVVLAAVRGAPSARTEQVREALKSLMRAAGQVQKVGVNLNQAVAKLNATGQRSDDLGPIAAYCARVVTRLDEAAIELRKKSA